MQLLTAILMAFQTVSTHAIFIIICSLSYFFCSVIIGFADLASSNLDETLQQHCKFSRFRGIRQMLNFHPDKPEHSIATRDYLTDENWIKGFGLLEKYNLSFELQVLPHQMHRYIYSVTT